MHVLFRNVHHDRDDVLQRASLAQLVVARHPLVVPLRCNSSCDCAEDREGEVERVEEEERQEDGGRRTTRIVYLTILEYAALVRAHRCVRMLTRSGAYLSCIANADATMHESGCKVMRSALHMTICAALHSPACVLGDPERACTECASAQAQQAQQAQHAHACECSCPEARRRVRQACATMVHVLKAAPALADASAVLLACARGSRGMQDPEFASRCFSAAVRHRNVSVLCWLCSRHSFRNALVPFARGALYGAIGDEVLQLLRALGVGEASGDEGTHAAPCACGQRLHKLFVRC